MKRAEIIQSNRTDQPLVVITGFMGTGKTETGRALAGILGRDFVDTDALIEEKEGISISEIFERSGEARFRALEQDACRSLAEREGLVVATGGGTLIDESNFDTLARRGTLVLLEASVEEILKRVGSDGTRPLLESRGGGHPVHPGVEDRIRSILEDRRPFYHKIAFRVDTTEVTPSHAARRIAAGLNVSFETITTRLADRVAEPGEDPGFARSPMGRIEIGRGLLSALGARLRALGMDARAFLLMPGNIRDLFLEQVAASLDGEAIPWECVVVRDGDAEKTLKQAGDIIDALASRGASRDCTVVAVGGGVVGDLGGFAASVYMRGVPLVHVPTTLLAQVDSSIGGKVGVNHPRAKNLVGNFYLPRLVVSDPCALRTLPDSEISNGMAEVVKTAIIGSADFLEFIEAAISEDVSNLRSAVFLERCVAECAKIKAEIVDRDPFERDLRRVLNLGHTLGHALEAVDEYHGLTHGQAVSIGMVAAMKIAEGRGLVNADLVERTGRILNLCGLPTTPPDFDRASFIRSLHLDKKKKSGRLHFVLPTGIGSVVIVDDVTEAELLGALTARRREER